MVKQLAEREVGSWQKHQNRRQSLSTCFCCPLPAANFFSFPDTDEKVLPQSGFYEREARAVPIEDVPDGCAV